jgi:WD40 repeat protein
MLWDIKTGQKVLELSEDNNKSEVTCLTSNGRTGLIASGHSDGTIRIFDYNSSQLKVTLSGHKSVVTAFCFDVNGLRPASGGKDTEIVIWDVTNESGLFRLKGHKGIVTQLQFMAQHNCILSSSKVKSCDLLMIRNECKTAVLLSNNSIEFYSFKLSIKPQVYASIHLEGHRSDVRTVAFSSDNFSILSASAESLKVWNRTSGK